MITIDLRKKSQEFIDGALYAILRWFYHSDINNVTDLKNAGVTLLVDDPEELDFDIVTEHGLGTGSEIDFTEAKVDSMTDLLKYLEEATGREYAEYQIGDYLSTFYYEEQEVGGHEKDQSFTELFTFDDLDFYSGLKYAVEILKAKIYLGSAFKVTEL